MHGFDATAVADRSHVAVVAWTGLLALAVAMGIGRFAFTPIMPMMEADAGLTLKAAGWLAAANYLGYLVGALSAARLSLTQGTRGGLLLTAVVTFAMGLTHWFWLQLILRFAAGVVSAWVMVHVSAWAVSHLLSLGRADANGIVFAGVGVGIAVAGLVVLAAMQVRLDSDRTWEVFGLLSLAATGALWWVFRTGPVAPLEGGERHPRRIGWTADKWRLTWCYGAMGFAYIIPATYLPDMAHRYVSDPLVFGLAWPVFGTASALATWAIARWCKRFPDRKLWAVCFVLMMVGDALPALWPTLATILVSALLVGGTFMTIVVTALREARRAVGEADPTAFIAAMTAAFAVCQIMGPVVVSSVERFPHGFAAALLAAAVLALFAAVSMWRSAGRMRAA